MTKKIEPLMGSIKITPYTEAEVRKMSEADVKALLAKSSKGHWQKEVPKKSGQYWVADRNGLSAGLKQVSYDSSGKLVYAGVTSGSWQGWWWSELVEEPKPPSSEAWGKDP